MWRPLQFTILVIYFEILMYKIFHVSLFLSHFPFLFDRIFFCFFEVHFTFDCKQVENRQTYGSHGIWGKTAKHTHTHTHTPIIYQLIFSFELHPCTATISTISYLAGLVSVCVWLCTYCCCYDFLLQFYCYCFFFSFLDVVTVIVKMLIVQPFYRCERKERN